MADKQTKIEIVVGFFMLVALACISYIAIQLGDLQVLGQESYIVNARFTSSSGLRSGAFVEAAGVRVGTVDSIVFDRCSFPVSDYRVWPVYRYGSCPAIL